MEWVMSIAAGVLFAVATYLILSKSVLRVVLGLSVISHGAHILLLTMGGLKRGASPVLSQEAANYTDPLPQALILTAIVINFGVTAVLLVLAYRSYQALETDDLEQLKEARDE